MTNFPANVSTETYHYDNQLRQYIVQFMAVFAGLQVAVGKNDSGDTDRLIDVQVRYGSSDRVVAAIRAHNTQNVPIRLPTMAAYMVGIDMNPEARKGVGVVNRFSTLPRGASFPDGIRVVQRENPIPYKAIFELAIMASNADQHFQILEQLLTLFNPIIQIQTSDDAYDWKRITTVELTNIGLEENYPVGTDSRIIQTVLTFVVPIWLAPPTTINKNFVAAIKLRLEAVAGDKTVTEIVTDLGRTLPNYETLIDASTMDFPAP